MNIIATRNSIVLIVLVFITAIVFGILSKQSIDTQEIKYYLENTASVAQAHNKWLKDYRVLTELYTILDKNQKIEDLNKLLDQMEEIKTSVDESTPPNKLENVKAKWGNECHLILQAVFLLIQGIERNNIEWISEAYDLLIEAENTRRQWKEYLSNLLINNDIEINDNTYSIYFN